MRPPVRRIALNDIAEAARGLDDIDAELAAQPPDEHFDRVEVAVEILVVKVFDQLAARHDAPDMVHEIAQQAIFVARQLHRDVVDDDAAGAGVEPNRADDNFRRRMAGGAPQQRAQPRKQLLHVKRLGYVIVGAGVKTLDLVAPTVARGENQHRRQPAGLAPGGQDADPVPLGQADVEHDRVIGLGVAEKPALIAVERTVDGVAGPLKGGRHLTVEIAVVFDNEEAHGDPWKAAAASSWPAAPPRV